MTDDNDLTLKTYNENINAYINDQEKEIPKHQKQFILHALGQISKSDRILELGSGAGRDADWIESNGYTVERTDGSVAFVNYIKSRGRQARALNALKDDFDGPYDLVYASAVLFHFTRSQTSIVLRKVTSALAQNGILALRMKEGNREEWTSEKMGAPRLMVYWSREALQAEVTAAGLSVISTTYSEFHGNKWIMIIARNNVKGSAR